MESIKLEFIALLAAKPPCLSLWEHPRVVSLALRAIHLQVPPKGAERV